MAREIEDIKSQLISEFEQAFNQTAIPLPRGAINTLATVLAGQSAQLELYADDRIREIFSADGIRRRVLQIFGLTWWHAPVSRQVLHGL